MAGLLCEPQFIPSSIPSRTRIEHTPRTSTVPLLTTASFMRSKVHQLLTGEESCVQLQSKITQPSEEVPTHATALVTLPGISEK